MRRAALAVSLIIFATSLLAQEGGPFIGRPVRFDVSPPMYTIAGPPDASAAKSSIPLKKFPPGPGSPDPVIQDEPGPPAAITPGIRFDAIGVGLGSYDPNVAPPDTNMAVGPNHIVQWVNLDWAIFTK